MAPADPPIARPPPDPQALAPSGWFRAGGGRAAAARGIPHRGAALLPRFFPGAPPGAPPKPGRRQRAGTMREGGLYVATKFNRATHSRQRAGAMRKGGGGGGSAPGRFRQPPRSVRLPVPGGARAATRHGEFRQPPRAVPSSLHSSDSHLRCLRPRGRSRSAPAPRAACAQFRPPGHARGRPAFLRAPGLAAAPAACGTMPAAAPARLAPVSYNRALFPTRFL